MVWLREIKAGQEAIPKSHIVGFGMAAGDSYARQESMSSGRVASKSTPYQGFSGLLNVTAMVRAV